MSKQTKAEKQAELVKPATTNEPATTQAVKPEPTSEKLEELKKAKSAAMASAASAQIAGDEKAAEDKFLEVYKIGEDIKRELAAIKQHEAELLKKEKEAAIVKLLDDQNAAYHAAQLSIGNDKMTLEEKQALSDDYRAKYEVVVNRLLGSRPASTATKTASAGTRGATSSEIRQMILDGLAKGQSITEVKADIKAAGYARGTVDTTATNMKKAGEIDY